MSVQNADHDVDIPEQFRDVPIELWAKHKVQTVDFRHINELIVPLPAFVPDITNILTSIPADHTYFSVFDSVPVDVETQPLLAGEFEGRQYCSRGLSRVLLNRLWLSCA